MPATGRPRLVKEGSPMIYNENDDYVAPKVQVSRDSMNGISSSLLQALVNEDSDEEGPPGGGKQYYDQNRSGRNGYGSNGYGKYSNKKQSSSPHYNQEKQKCYVQSKQQTSFQIGGGNGGDEESKRMAVLHGQLKVVEKHRKYMESKNGESSLSPILPSMNGLPPIAKNTTSDGGGEAAENDDMDSVENDTTEMIKKKEDHISYSLNHHYEVGRGAPTTLTTTNDSNKSGYQGYYQPKRVPPHPTAAQSGRAEVTPTTSRKPKNHCYEIGVEPTEQMDVDSIDHNRTEIQSFRNERMEGIEDHSIKPPLVVLDGANVAYAYGSTKLSSLNGNSGANGKLKAEPDVMGIKVACDYFKKAGVRTIVVLPSPWLNSRPNRHDGNRSNSQMVTPQMELLDEYKQQGELLASPPKDDDDSYAITIARLECARENGSSSSDGSTPRRRGYVLSNDQYRDAAARDDTGSLQQWLNGNNTENGAGRISFAFCNMSSIDTYGDPILDIVANPRHSLISWIKSNK